MLTDLVPIATRSLHAVTSRDLQPPYPNKQFQRSKDVYSVKHTLEIFVSKQMQHAVCNTTRILCREPQPQQLFMIIHAYMQMEIIIRNTLHPTLKP